MTQKEAAIPEPTKQPIKLTTSLRGTREVRENCQIFGLTGLLDAFSEAIFRKAILRCMEQGSSNLIFDMSTIEFVDSSGLGALVQLAKAATERGGILQ
ncbi:MAG: STAS domain-containing protein, partial [Merismopedia sp. SIO2A8]|nr:STAS domain-containing protein [Merismopedia sp. SIO2A8]